MPIDRKHEINILCIIVAFFPLMLCQPWWNVWSQVEAIPHSEFEAQFDTAGMHPTFGNRTHAIERNRVLGEAGLECREVASGTERGSDLLLRTLVADAYEPATAILTETRSATEEGAGLLIERDALSAEELPGLVEPSTEAAKKSGGEAA